MGNNAVSQNHRVLYFDYMRLLACFLVIVNHTILPFYQFSRIDTGHWFLSDYLFFLSKTAVPLFLLISGALLLKRNESYRKTYMHRVLRFALILLVWSYIYMMFWWEKWIPSLGNIRYIIKIAVEGDPASAHLWYLYMILGIYLMLPFIRRMVRNFSEKDFYFFIALWTCFTCILPLVSMVKSFKLVGSFQVPLFTGYLGYFIIGYYIDTISFSRRAVYGSAVLLLLGLSSSAFYTYHLSRVLGKTASQMDNPLLLPTMVASISLFIIVKKMGLKINGWMEKHMLFKKAVVHISGCTLGIYIVHILINSALQREFGWISHWITYSFHHTMAYDLALFALSYAVIAGIRLVPGIRRIVS